MKIYEWILEIYANCRGMQILKSYDLKISNYKISQTDSNIKIKKNTESLNVEEFLIQGQSFQIHRKFCISNEVFHSYKHIVIKNVHFHLTYQWYSNILEVVEMSKYRIVHKITKYRCFHSQQILKLQFLKE